MHKKDELTKHIQYLQNFFELKIAESKFQKSSTKLTPGTSSLKCMGKEIHV